MVILYLTFEKQCDVNNGRFVRKVFRRYRSCLSMKFGDGFVVKSTTKARVGLSKVTIPPGSVMLG
jgi:hypothetical protein